jgi:SAM-dependent methyltransferase
MRFVPKWLADLGLAVNRRYYKELYRSMYRGSKQHPSWFDHRIDLYYHWPNHVFWMERGILPLKRMFEGCRVLDLFCGDGFFSFHFYSSLAGRIDAIDKDPDAIAHAEKCYSHPRIRFQVVDAAADPFPGEAYDVIVWFEGLDHITREEYAVVISRVKRALDEKGVLAGSIGVVAEEKRGKVHWEHKNEFSSVEGLHSLLAQDFDRVRIQSTTYPDLSHGKRHVAYFEAEGPKR